MIKVSDLDGAALCYWALHADGKLEELCGPIKFSEWMSYSKDCAPPFDLNWEFAGPIIERERIAIAYWSPHWSASPHDEYGRLVMVGEGSYVCEVGPLPLIAAMRSFVALKFGREVSND